MSTGRGNNGGQLSAGNSRLGVTPAGSASAQASGSGTSTPLAGPQQTTDIYRPLPSALQKPIAHLLPSHTGPLPSSAAALFSLDPTTFTSRLKNKNILLDTQSFAASQPSALITGKKLHKGHPELKKRAREEHEHNQQERAKDGVEGLRGVKRKLKERETKGVLDAGMEISYSSLLPLRHLHLTYLTHLLSLPPFPSPSSPLTSAPPTPYPPSGLPPGLSPEGIQSRLSKADLTGLHISVVSARNPSLANLSGIIIEETSSTFRLVSSSSPRVKVIPKSGTLFEVIIPAYAPPNFEAAGELYEGASGERPGPIDWEAHKAVCPRLRILLLGTAFGFRSGDRAGRKFRPAQGGGGGSGWGEDWVKGEWADVLGSVEKDLEVRSGLAGSGGTREKVLKKAKRKRNKGRRKDPPSWGRLEVP